MPFVVIMAGGRGERFWPLSRMAKPKQFLSLIGGKTMLQLTVERIKDLAGITDTYIVAGAEFKDLILEQLPQLPEENIIIEPFGRNTAAAIGLAALVLGQKNPREVMLVLPADHYISNVRNFHEVLRSAIVAASRGEKIVTLGITPHSPETGYGYIHRGEQFDTNAGIPAYQAVQFLEKPDYTRALELLASGEYLWNSGMFIWRNDVIRAMIGKHIPSLAEGLVEIEDSLGTEHYPQKVEEVYEKLPKVSIDYGVMEQADNVLVIPCDFGWDDIGCWTALDRYMEKDEDGNILQGQGVLLNTTNTSIVSPDRPVALIGVEDLIVVNSHDSLLICHKSQAQEIKKVVQALRDNGFDDVL